MILAWLVAFAWTIALELPVYVAFTRGGFARWWTPCALAFAVNLATHPLLWIYEVSGTGNGLFSETLVILAEGTLAGCALWRGSRSWTAFPRALTASACANALSAVAGAAIL